MLPEGIVAGGGIDIPAIPGGMGMGAGEDVFFFFMTMHSCSSRRGVVRLVGLR